MSISAPFIHRPVATTLLTVALGLSGVIAYNVLPVAPLPQVDYPAIQVFANLPGASPEIMASSVATPLERQFGRIAGLNELTSSSTLGQTNITLQFDLDRDINAAARDVQAGINAARNQLPANLPQNPTWRKNNPSDPPIINLILTSDTMTPGQMYDVATTILQQKVSQIKGVGQVTVGGSSLPGVRVEVNPTLLNNFGLGLEDVRTMLASANTNRPKGEIASDTRAWTLATTDQLLKARDYQDLIVAYRKGAAVKLSDIADVVDSVEDLRNAGYADGLPGVIVNINRQPGANIIETVDRIRAALAQLQAQIPAAIHLEATQDKTVTIRASVRDVQHTMAISLGLVIMVIFVFLRSPRTTFIPSIAVPTSLLGTFGVMYLFGYSVDNLSLMALTIATGFVVDDAIVVIENITRHMEHGMRPMEAALHGASEIGFTVLSISISLIAVFIPILLMGGIVGRLFREFAVTLASAIFLSMVISLTATPMMCARLLRNRDEEKHGFLYRASESGFNAVLGGYREVSRVGIAPPAADLGRDAYYHRPFGLPVHHRAQGLLPSAGHQPADRNRARRPSHVFPGDEGPVFPGRQHRANRSRHQEPERFCGRRQRLQHRTDVRRAQAAGAAEGQLGPGDGADPPKTDQHSRRPGILSVPAGSARGWTIQFLPISVHDAQR